MTLPDETTELCRRLLSTLSREVSLACDTAGLVRWADERAERSLGAGPGVRITDLAMPGHGQRLFELVMEAVAGRVAAGRVVLRGVPEPAGYFVRAMLHGDEVLVVGSIAFEHRETDHRLGVALEEISGLRTELARRDTQLRELMETLERQARIDPLTGLATRRHFMSAVDLEQKRSIRYDRAFAVVVLDIEGFRALNEQQGEVAGDTVLGEVAVAIRHAIRDVDTAARIGGDEFGILLPETDARGAEHTAERVRVSIRSRTQNAIDVALGTVRGRTESAEQLVRLGMEAMEASRRKARR